MDDNPGMATHAVIFRNRVNAFLWGFTLVWMGMLAAFTWLYFADGEAESTRGLLEHGALLLFWLGGLGLVGWASASPCSFVSVSPGGTVRFTRRYPFRAERWQIAAGEASPAEVVESRDSDGDPYFYARIRGPRGEAFDLAESHSRELCEAACERFNRAIN